MHDFFNDHGTVIFLGVMGFFTGWFASKYL